MNDDLSYHQQLVGRAIAYLIGKGLRRVDIEPSDYFDIMVETRGDEEEAIQTFSDVLHWMRNEGLIRVGSVQSLWSGEIFNGVQLTQKAIEGIKMPVDILEGETIETTAKKEGLTGDTYGKIGEALGGFVAGAVKGFAG